jgi:hypothetical protein
VEDSIEDKWDKIKATLLTAGAETLGYKEQARKESMSAESWKLIEERRAIKQELINSKRGLQDRLIREAYNEKNKEVKKKIRNDKRHWIDEQVKEAEEAARIGNLKELYDTTRVLSRKKFTGNKSVKGIDGNLITCKEEQLKRWTEHLEKNTKQECQGG